MTGYDSEDIRLTKVTNVHVAHRVAHKMTPDFTAVIGAKCLRNCLIARST